MSGLPPSPIRPPRRMQVLIALTFAAVGGLIAIRAQFIVHANGGDLYVTWRAVRILASGGDPYAIIRAPSPWAWNTPWLYPLPAALLAAPVMGLSPTIAACVFVTASAGLLGFALARSGQPWFPILTSVPFLYCAQMSQMTFAIMGFGLIPLLAGLVVLKPNLGLSLFVWRPTWRSAFVSAVLMIASIIVFPSWPSGWMASVAQSTSHGAPIMRGFGFIGLLGLARWRTREARLLVCMTLAPATLSFYDELPLFLVARSPRESMVLCLGSWIAWIAWLAVTPPSQNGGVSLLHARSWIILGMYLPATLMVLRRPNDGELPMWLEARTARLPAWLRGNGLRSTS